MSSWYDAWADRYEDWSPPSFTAEVSLYVGLARDADGPLVELAVGTGRVATLFALCAPQTGTDEPHDRDEHSRRPHNLTPPSRRTTIGTGSALRVLKARAKSDRYRGPAGRLRWDRTAADEAADLAEPRASRSEVREKTEVGHSSTGGEGHVLAVDDIGRVPLLRFSEC
jgi:hypothetical protein